MSEYQFTGGWLIADRCLSALAALLAIAILFGPLMALLLVILGIVSPD